MIKKKIVFLNNKIISFTLHKNRWINHFSRDKVVYPKKEVKKSIHNSFFFCCGVDFISFSIQAQRTLRGVDHKILTPRKYLNILTRSASKNWHACHNECKSIIHSIPIYATWKIHLHSRLWCNSRIIDLESPVVPQAFIHESVYDNRVIYFFFFDSSKWFPRRQSIFPIYDDLRDPSEVWRQSNDFFFIRLQNSLLSLDIVCYLYFVLVCYMIIYSNLTTEFVFFLNSGSINEQSVFKNCLLDLLDRKKGNISKFLFKEIFF